MSERGWMEYGSEFDWRSNDALMSGAPQSFVQDDWQLYRSGLYTLFSFLFVTTGLTIVCMLPNSIRKIVYRSFLRAD